LVFRTIIVKKAARLNLFFERSRRRRGRGLVPLIFQPKSGILWKFKELTDA